MKIVFLVSGNGGNLKFINSCIKKKYILNSNLIVIADRNCGALDYAKKNNIDNYLINYSRQEKTDLIKLLKSLETDLIITNIHKILDEEIVEMHKGKMINLHYSLLPAYSGLIGEEPIERAIRYSKFVGITLHYVEREVDSGEVIIQGIIKNTGDKTEITNKIFRMGCFSLLFYIYKSCPECKQANIHEQIGHNEYFFSPELNFNTSMFDEKFWNELRG